MATETLYHYYVPFSALNEAGERITDAMSIKVAEPLDHLDALNTMAASIEVSLKVTQLVVLNIIALGAHEEEVDEE